MDMRLLLLVCSRIWLLTILFHSGIAIGENFYGGMLSSAVEQLHDGTHKVTVTHVTNWVLGKGPCGPGCSYNDEGRSTRTSRLQAMTILASTFGLYDGDYRNTKTHQTEIKKLTHEFKSTFDEKVIAVSEFGKWEEDLLHFKFQMPNDTEVMDLNFDGDYWRTLSDTQVYISPTPFHMQTKVSTKIRSDTGKPNTSPMILTRPIYRVKLGKTSEIRLTAIDADGDLTKCRLSRFIEAKYLPTPPNVTVHNNCSIFINASPASNYTDNTWIAVPITVRDYPMQDVTYGTDRIPTGQFSMTASSVQIAIQVLANLTTPEFVHPTADGNHVFIVYSGALLRTDIYVQATVNRSIARIAVKGLEDEGFSMTWLEQDNSRQQVKHSTLTWQASTVNTRESHVACVDAIDNTGEDTAVSRCFKVELRGDLFNYSANATKAKPSFFDIPHPTQQVRCNAMATCIIPLYIKSAVHIDTVVVTKSFVDIANIGPVEATEYSYGGLQVFKADLSFQHSYMGELRVCFTALDMNGRHSNEECILTKIVPLDPCLSTPCRNSATCVSNEDTGTFTCHCYKKFSGQFCSIKEDLCIPNLCVPEHTKMCYSSYGCYCNHGFFGERCEYITGDCKSNPCHHGSTCIERNNTYTCRCRPGFSGANCTTDVDECSVNPCQNGGTCHDAINSYNCTCHHGYKGANCEQSYTLKDAIDVKCSLSHWEISVDMDILAAIYPNVTWHDIYLGRTYCFGNLENSTLNFQYDINECGSSKSTSEVGLIYSNKLIYAILDPTVPFLIRNHFWTFNIECDFVDGSGTSHLHHGTNEHSETFVQQNNVTVEIFRDPGFLHLLSRDGQQIHVGDEVYVKVSTSIKDWNTKMRLHTCFTKPYGNASSTDDIILINDGCEVGSNTHIISQSTHESRFVFQDFEYANNNEGLDVYCNATFCESRDYSSRCMQSCHNEPAIVG